MSEKVRVRFAPSPTGPLHIGGVRTALFNYLFARKNGGDFLLRIEDTDQTRFVEGAEKYIIESLNWLGIQVDEGVEKGGSYGPYRQSERKDIYKEYANDLILNGWAYYAFDTPEELDRCRKEAEELKQKFSYDQHNRNELNNSLDMGCEELKKRLESGVPYVIRFKMPENEDIIFNDSVRGTVKFNTRTLDDKVIFKSDGFPTYHLANVVDDHLMQISHVIRGEEWLPSTPLHIMLYKALGWESVTPQFAHLPLILKPSGKGKLSKRDGDKDGFPVFPLEWVSPEGEKSAGYRESGYFAEAVINILVLLGWNPGNEQELFTMEALIEAFDLEKVNKAGARFDPEKARWFNQQYLQIINNTELATLFSADLQKRGVSSKHKNLTKIVAMIKERCTFVADFWDQSAYFFVAPAEYDAKAQKKFWNEGTPKIIEDCLQILKDAEPFTSELTEQNVKTYIESNELGFGKVMNPLRLAIVGAGKGAHLFDIFEIIGKAETLRRLERALERL